MAIILSLLNRFSNYFNGRFRCKFASWRSGLWEGYGVTFTTDLKTTAHCKYVYSKANRMLGLLSRTIKYKNPAVLTTLYKSLVMPHLEYCSTIWNPHYTCRILAGRPLRNYVTAPQPSGHQSRNRPIFFPRSRSSLVLKPLTVFAITESLSSIFQLDTTRWEKKYFLIS